MTTRKVDGSGGTGNYDGERPLRRKVNVPKNANGRTIVDGMGTTHIPEEGYDDIREEIEEVSLKEIFETRQAKKPLPDKENYNKVKQIINKEEIEETSNTKVEFIEEKIENQMEEISIQKPKVKQVNNIPQKNYSDGVIQIISNGTPEGTIITLNGRQLDVKIIFSLNIIGI